MAAPATGSAGFFTAAGRFLKIRENGLFGRFFHIRGGKAVGVGFYGVRECVHATFGCPQRRERGGERGIKHGHLRNQAKVADSSFFVCAGFFIPESKNGGGRDLRTCSGRGWDGKKQRQSPPDPQNAAHFYKRFSGAGQSRADRFGTVKDRTAAQRHERVATVLPVAGLAKKNFFLGRIGCDGVKNRDRDSFFQASGKKGFGRAATQGAGRGQKKGAPNPLLFKQGRQFSKASFPGKRPGRCFSADPEKKSPYRLKNAAKRVHAHFSSRKETVLAQSLSGPMLNSKSPASLSKPWS